MSVIATSPSLAVGGDSEAKSALPSPSVLCVGLAAITLSAVSGLGLYGYNLSSQPLGVSACLVLLLFGLPHGSLDLELLRRNRVQNRVSLPILLIMYLGLAVASYAVWITSPLLAFTLFLVTAVVHFAEDWHSCSAPFLSHAIAVATLSAPALFHRQSIEGLFVTLTGNSDASNGAELLLLVAPVAILTAFVGCADLWRNGRKTEVASGAVGLLAMLSLPPLIGFAIYFCLLHSPVHLAANWRQVRSHPRVHLRRRTAATIVVLLTLGALGIAALIYTFPQPFAPPDRIFRSAFITLSILTVPHMLMPKLVTTVSALLEKPTSRQRQRIYV